jgi:hypothetical protein
VKSLAIIVLAVLVSAGSSAAVTSRLITSRDIKNGTIQPIDLSTNTKHSLQGFQTVQRVFGQVLFSNQDPGPKLTTAECPQGSTLVGGGFSSGPGQTVTVSESTPDQDGAQQWNAIGKYDGSGQPNPYLFSYALCAS